MVKKSRKKQLRGKSLQNLILKTLRRQSKKRLSAKQIQKKLKIGNSKDSITAALNHLVGKGEVNALRDGKFQFKHLGDQGKSTSPQLEKAIFEGFVDMTRTGSAYIVCDELHEDVFVPADQLNTAMHDDFVRVQLITRRRARRLNGKIIEILERAASSFVGTLQVFPHYGVVVPSHFKHNIDVIIELDDLQGAEEGDNVVIEIKSWEGGATKTPVGKVTRILTGLEDNEVELQSILINNGFDLEFSSQTMEELSNLQANISEEEITQRRDLRQVPTFTIDPDDAKDFDDAISVKSTGDGGFEIGVHIADVSHFVEPKTALDKDAYKRSTSVYLVGSVLPMLPEKLSNELCSLRPNEDKLTFSAVFKTDNGGRIIDTWFGKTIIHSQQRFTYMEAQKILESGEGPLSQELRFINRFAKKLRKEKFKNGAIAFESDEIQFELSSSGAPEKVFKKQRVDSHMLVEDLMLLANRSVATYIQKIQTGKEIPFVYRVHDIPDPDKLERFAYYARQMGHRLNFSTPDHTSKSFNYITSSSVQDPTLKILQPLAIRCMSKAEYSTNNIGHYGLAFANYTHFTSPIRRYSDILVHRLLFDNLKAPFRVDKNTLDAQCKHISQQERKAMDAERESIKLKQVQYLQKFVGDNFKGRISGIMDFGLFIELIDNGCEGLVRFDSFGEPFELDERNFSARGFRSGKTYKLGDEVEVLVVSTNIERREIDLEISS